jgi:hypothetical protein
MPKFGLKTLNGHLGIEGLKLWNIPQIIFHSYSPYFIEIYEKLYYFVENEFQRIFKQIKDNKTSNLKHK